MTIKKLFIAILAAGAAGIIFGCANPSAAMSEQAVESPREYSYDIDDQCYYTSACYSVTVGSSAIDTSRLKPYHAMWTQDVPGDGGWVRSQGTFEESLSQDEDGNWRHVQIQRPGNGSASIGTRRLDGKTFQILDLTLEFEDMPPEQPAKVFYNMTGDSFAADITMNSGEKKQGKPRKLAMPMFDGQIGGLVISALPLKEKYVATLPMVIPNLGIYWIEASVVGRKEIPTADGASVEVWEVNANWFNLTDGDIYGPGRDGSGGVYYIAVEPGDGIPPVIEYVNNGAIIAWDGVRKDAP